MIGAFFFLARSACSGIPFVFVFVLKLDAPRFGIVAAGYTFYWQLPIYFMAIETCCTLEGGWRGGGFQQFRIFRGPSFRLFKNPRPQKDPERKVRGILPRERGYYNSNCCRNSSILLYDRKSFPPSTKNRKNWISPSNPPLSPQAYIIDLQQWTPFIYILALHILQQYIYYCRLLYETPD